MTPAAFIDANIPIYAAGRAHPLKEPCAQILLLTAEHPQAFVTDSEVFQELLHRYLALRLWPQGKEVFWRFRDLMADRVEPIRVSDVESAASLADVHHQLSSRDLLHAAVMQRLGLVQIISADAGFDVLPGLQRLNPAELARWRESVLS